MNENKVLGISRRGNNAPVSTRLVRTIPATRASTSYDHWIARNWGLVITVVTTVVTVALSLGKSNTSRLAMASSARVGHQTLFASPKSRGGVSIATEHGSSRRSRGRVLQSSTSSSSATIAVVEYETELQLFMCNPTLEEEGNDAYLVDEANLAVALSKVNGLTQADADDVMVTIKTGPMDADDESYMCEVDGMLQWHARIRYSAADARAGETTPAVMAAQANDYVAYSLNEFKTLLARKINEQYAAAEPVELSAADILVPTVGWIVTFPEEESGTQETATARSWDGLAMELRSDSSLWVWWVWLIYGLLVACCLVPLCCCLHRRREDEKNSARERLETTRNGRGDEDLAKSRGPECGITELDFEGDYNAHQNMNMKREYGGAGEGIEPTGYRPPSHRARQQSVSAQAWMQEAGKNTSRSPQPSSNSSRQSHGRSPVARRFDIDDVADDRVGTLRSEYPQHSFDVGRRGFSGRGGESKS